MPKSKKSKSPDAATATEAKEPKKGRSKAAKPVAVATGKPGRGTSAGSQLSLAADILRKAGSPMNCKNIMECIEKAGWKSDGKTPAATLYSSIIREISKKGAQSRFRKVDRGQFEYAGA